MSIETYDYDHLAAFGYKWETNGNQYSRVLDVPNGFVNNCFLCNRPIDERKASWVHLSTKGGLFPVNESDETTQGWFPVGSECAKKLPKTHVKNNKEA
jgi:hypothetical protein